MLWLFTLLLLSVGGKRTYMRVGRERMLQEADEDQHQRLRYNYSYTGGGHDFNCRHGKLRCFFQGRVRAGCKQKRTVGRRETLL